MVYKAFYDLTSPNCPNILSFSPAHSLWSRQINAFLVFKYAYLLLPQSHHSGWVQKFSSSYEISFPIYHQLLYFYHQLFYFSTLLFITFWNYFIWLFVYMFIILIIRTNYKLCEISGLHRSGSQQTVKLWDLQAEGLLRSALWNHMRDQGKHNLSGGESGPWCKYKSKLRSQW